MDKETQSKGAEMTSTDNTILLATTVRDATSDNPADVVVPKGTTGEVWGGGYDDENGREFYAIDFGNVMCDLYAEDLEFNDASS